MAAPAAPAFVHVPELAPPGTELELSAAESHYLARVCRARVGDTAEASDGSGTVATLRVLDPGARVRVRIERVERVARAREAWLLCGAPEGQRDDWMVEKLAELGVTRWQPIATERGRWEGFARKRERWERLAVAALKQSRSAWRMELAEPAPLADAVTALPAAARRALASPAGGPPSAITGDGPLAGVVGPAGGLTGSEEKWLLGLGFRPVCLAGSRLRAETAAVALAAVWAAGL